MGAVTKALVAELLADPEALAELARALRAADPDRGAASADRLLTAAQPPVDDQRALTVAEAAQRAACHQETIRRAARDGRLPALRVGRAIRVRASDVDAWLAGGAARDAPAPRARPRRSPARHDRPMAAALQELRLR